MMNDVDLIERYIEENPHRPGVDEARVRQHGAPVWALVGHLDAAGGDLDTVAHDYRLPREAVDAALAYYRRHKDAIDARLATNAA